MVEKICTACWAALAFLLLGTGSATHAAKVDVIVDPEGLAQMNSVLLVPLGCGQDEGCRKVEDALAQAVRQELGVKVVSRKKVERAIEIIGLTELSRPLVHLLAREVKADACLWVRTRVIDRNRSMGVILGAVSIGLPLRMRSARVELVGTHGGTLIEGRSKGHRGLVHHVENILKEASREGREGRAVPDPKR